MNALWFLAGVWVGGAAAFVLLLVLYTRGRD